MAAELPTIVKNLNLSTEPVTIAEEMVALPDKPMPTPSLTPTLTIDGSAKGNMVAQVLIIVKNTNPSTEPVIMKLSTVV